MHAKTRWSLVVGALVFGALATPALAQSIKERSLQNNPYRQAGGSCVYGRNGELLNQPKGVVCASQEEAPGAAAPGTSDRFAGLPPALRSEATALVASHGHVADHLVELRRAVASNEKTRAIAISDEIAKELIDHLAREQALFEKLAAEHRAH